MLIVADSSPLVALVTIGHVGILPELFGKVVIPPAVAAELTSPARHKSVQEFASAPPPWLEIKRPVVTLQIPRLHPGELEAISLAVELQADLVLIDERRAYKEALARKINAVGTVRVIERAAAQNLLDLKAAFDRLKQTDFWISAKLLDGRLELFRKQTHRGLESQE